MGTDAYTQEELEAALAELEAGFYRAGRQAYFRNWDSYRKIMRDIDLQYRQLRSQGPGLGSSQ